MNRELRKLMRQGQALYEARSFDEAYYQFTLAIQIVEEEQDDCGLSDSEIAELYLTRGAILATEDEAIALNDPDIFHQIMEDYDTAIETCPPQFYYRNLRGRMYLNCAFANYTEEAKEDFGYVLEMDPQDAGALKHMGQACSRQENYPRAIEYFTRSIASHPDTEAYLHRAFCHFKSTPPDFEAAAEDFGRALEQLPRLEELYLWRAQCFQGLGRIEDAIKEYDRLLEISPGDAGYYVDRGALRTPVDPLGAQEDFDRAIKVGNHPLAYNNRACYFLQLGYYEQAAADAKSALAADPKCNIAYATLAEIYAKQGNREQFLHFLTLALQHYYDDIIEVLENPAFSPFLGDKQVVALLGQKSLNNHVA
jgi:tetratricopeptide (TPR) repeat protein